MAMAELLVRRGANANTIIDASGCAMHLAVNHGNKPLVALLLRHGGVLGWDRDEPTWEPKPTPGFVVQLSDDYTAAAGGKILVFEDDGSPAPDGTIVHVVRWVVDT